MKEELKKKQFHNFGRENRESALSLSLGGEVDACTGDGKSQDRFLCIYLSERFVKRLVSGPTVQKFSTQITTETHSRSETED